MIDVFELARTRGRTEGRVLIADLARLRTELRDASGVLDYRFEARTDVHGRPEAVLSLHGQLVLTCDRCGEPVAVPLDRSTSFYFVRAEAELAALPVSVEDEPEPLLGSDHFDLVALVEDEAILAVPLSPRHEECATKGSDKGATGGEGKPNPFATLEGLPRKKGR